MKGEGQEAIIIKFKLDKKGRGNMTDNKLVHFFQIVINARKEIKQEM